MLEIGTSGLMSGEGKRGVATWPSYRASSQLYHDRVLLQIPPVRARRNDEAAHLRQGSRTTTEAFKPFEMLHLPSARLSPECLICVSLSQDYHYTLACAWIAPPDCNAGSSILCLETIAYRSEPSNACATQKLARPWPSPCVPKAA